MKKYFLMLLSIIFVAATSVGFVSCGDDEEENITPVGGENTETSKHPTPLIFGSDNKHLTAIDYYPAGMNCSRTFSYNAEGVDAINDNDSGYTFQFTGNQNKLSAVHNSRSWRSYTANLSYNNLGYISTMRSALSSDTYDADADCPDLELKYDTMGRLLEVYEKRHLSDSNDYLWKFTWVNDTITTISQTNLSTGKVSYVAHYAYDGGKHPNKYRQYTVSLVPRMGHVGKIGSLFFVGYVGNGPAYLPTRRTLSNLSDALSYVINSDGVVKTETFNKGIGKSSSDNNVIYKYE